MLYSSSEDSSPTIMLHPTIISNGSGGLSSDVSESGVHPQTSRPSPHDYREISRSRLVSAGTINNYFVKSIVFSFFNLLLFDQTWLTLEIDRYGFFETDTDISAIHGPIYRPIPIFPKFLDLVFCIIINNKMYFMPYLFLKP